MSEPLMTLDELIAKVPEKFRPVIAEYGPALLKMTTEELWAWIDLLIKGDTRKAYWVVLDKMESGDRVAEWERLDAAWATADRKNADKLALQKSAALAVLRVLFTAALALVGL